MNDPANYFQSEVSPQLRQDLNVVLDLLHLLMMEETDETFPPEEVEVHGQKFSIKRNTPRLAVNNIDFEMIFSRLLKNSNFSSTEEFTGILKKDLEFKMNKYYGLPDKYKEDDQLILSADRFYRWLIGNEIAQKTQNHNYLPNKKRNDLPIPIQDLIQDTFLEGLEKILLELKLIRSRNPIISNISEKDYWKIHILSILMIEKKVLRSDLLLNKQIMLSDGQPLLSDSESDLLKRKLARSILSWIQGKPVGRIKELGKKSSLTFNNKQYLITSAAIKKHLYL